ncbi:MAG: DUF3301 domain-containing protein [Gammaproteobacteria bacterium]|nr:DUF3301 domain-containing protein [Gammaproteobacteria bacterium]
MLTLAEFLILVFFLGGGWYWYGAMRIKELARAAGHRRCGEVGVTFLDDTVSLTRLRVRRDQDGQLALYREFQFEFTSDGSARYGGEITLLGGRILGIVMEPYRETPPDPDAGMESARERAERKWLH